MSIRLHESQTSGNCAQPARGPARSKSPFHSGQEVGEQMNEQRERELVVAGEIGRAAHGRCRGPRVVRPAPHFTGSRTGSPYRSMTKDAQTRAVRRLPLTKGCIRTHSACVNAASCATGWTSMAVVAGVPGGRLVSSCVTAARTRETNPFSSSSSTSAHTPTLAGRSGARRQRRPSSVDGGRRPPPRARPSQSHPEAAGIRADTGDARCLVRRSTTCGSY